MGTPINVQGKDIPIELLVPLKEREINFKKNRGYRRPGNGYRLRGNRKQR